MKQDNELYWQEMFAWYEEHEPNVVAGVSVNNESRAKVTEPIGLEEKLALHGLNLRDLSFNEIIQGEFNQILAARGLSPLNNEDYYNTGGVA